MLVTFMWASAQTSNQMSASDMNSLTVTQAQEMGLKSDIKGLHSSTKATESRWYNYASTMDNALGGISSLALTYLFPDTQITAMFGTSASTPWMHSAGVIVDPTSAWYQSSTELNITNSMSYMLDSVGFLCVYSRNNANTSIVDTLVIEFLAGNSSDLPEYYFTGMSANFFSDTVRFKALVHTAGWLNAPMKQIVKIPLTAATAVDTTANGWNYIMAGPTTPIIIDGGEVVAFTYQFVAGYTYAQTDTLNENNYFTMTSYEEQGDDTYPTYAPGDYNSSQIMGSGSKFDPSDSWYGMYIPEWAYTQPYSFENHIVDVKLSSHVSVENNTINGLSVSQNHPNPFSGSTTINYNLDKAANVNVTIYNVAGAQVMTIAKGLQTAGNHQIQIDGSNLPAGVYYYTFTADNNTATKKMIVY